MKIVVLDGYALNPGDLSWDRLKSLGEVEIYDRTPEPLILERASGAEVLLTNKTPLDKTTLSSLSRLRYIGVLATGYNVVDVEEAKKKKHNGNQRSRILHSIRRPNGICPHLGVLPSCSRPQHRRSFGSVVKEQGFLFLEPAFDGAFRKDVRHYRVRENWTKGCRGSKDFRYEGGGIQQEQKAYG